MGPHPPPAVLPGDPTRVTLRKGTPVYRVHGSHRSPVGFKPVPSRPFYGGGRFDSTPLCPYGFLYLAFDVGTAVSETMLRSLPFSEDGSPRTLPRASVVPFRLSFLRLAADLETVSLMSGADLAAVGQDSWLVQAEEPSYPQTRDWGHWIRERTGPWAQGFVWSSKREPAGRVAILFEDRCAEPPLEPDPTPAWDFATPEGEARLNDVLIRYHARVAPMT